jgi:hypothetical protein
MSPIGGYRPQLCWTSVRRLHRDLSAVFWSIFKEPLQIPDLFRLAIDASLSFSGSNSNGSRSQLC